MSLIRAWLNFSLAVASDRTMVARTVHAIRCRIYSSAGAVAFRRDLSFPVKGAEKPVGLAVRPIEPDDIPRILDPTSELLSPEERWHRSARRRLLEAGFGSCYVVVNADSQPCYMAWLFRHRDNRKIRKYFAGNFPPLAEDEVLLESVFIPESFRGQNLMAPAQILMGEKAAEMGARWMLAFVGERNVPSIKGFLRSGFRPVAFCRQEWWLFKCRIRFISTDHGRSQLNKILALCCCAVDTSSGRQGGTAQKSVGAT